MIPFYLALYVVLRRAAPARALLALVFRPVLFVVSREATFSRWMLSDEYTAATLATDRATLLAAGTALLTLYNGSTFATSCVLGPPPRAAPTSSTPQRRRRAVTAPMCAVSARSAARRAIRAWATSSAVRATHAPASGE